MNMELLLLGLNSVLLTVCGFLFAFWMRSQSESYKDLRNRLDVLAQHPQNCLRHYADKDENAGDHRHLWKEVDVQRATLNQHDTRISILEGKVNA